MNLEFERLLKLFPVGQEVIFVTHDNRAIRGVVDDDAGTASSIFWDNKEKNFRVRIVWKNAEGIPRAANPLVHQVGIEE